MVDQRHSLIFFVAVALMAAVFAAGWVIPEGVAGGIFYVTVILIGWGFQKRAFILVLALMSSVLVLVGHGLHGPPMDVNSTVIVINHLLELNAIWLTAALLFVAKGEKYARQEGDKRIQDLKGAEKRAQDAEHQLADAINGLSDGIVLYDADERFVMCNSKYLEARKEFTEIIVPGTKFEDILRAVLKSRIGYLEGLDEDSMEDWIAKRLAKFRNPGTLDLRQYSDGHWESVHDYNTRDGGTLIIRTDITESKQAEEALRKSEERLRMIFESNPFGIAIVSLENNKRLYVNPAMVELFGASSVEELLAADLARTYADPADLKRLRSGTGKDFITEIEVERKRLDGTKWWCLLNRSLIEFEGQEALLGWHHDITARKKSEDAIHQSEEHLKAIIDSVPAFVNVKDTEGRYLMINRYYKDVLGLDEDDLIGKTSHAISRKNGLFARKVEKSVMDSGKAAPLVDYTVKDKHGRVRTLLVSKVPLRDASGEITGIISTSLDITERNRAEEALMAMEERNRLVLKNVVSGIITIDEKGFIETFNAAAEKIFGYGADEVIGKNVSLLMPEPDRSKHDNYLGKYLKTGKAKIIGKGREVEGLCKDGTVFPMELAVSEMTIAGKRMFTGLVEDISERKKAETRLRESEERFRDLAETASDWFWEMDSELRFTYMSDKYYEVTGRKPEDIIGKTRQKTADKTSREESPESWRKHLEDLKAGRPFANFIQSSLGAPGGPYEGKRYYLRLSGKPRFDDDGNFLGYRGTATDITRRMETEKEIRQARDELEQRVAERTRALSDEIEERRLTEEKVIQHARNELLLQSVALAANKAHSVEEAVKASLREVCGFSGWPVGHAYLVDENDPERLVPTGFWHMKRPKRFKALRKVTEETLFSPGVGLPGRVMESGEPAWIVDVTKDRNSPWARLAKDIGVKSGFAIPILVRGEVGGVLEFFSEEVHETDLHLLQVIRQVGSQVGQVIERTKALEQIAEAKEAAEISDRAKTDFLANMSHELRTPLNSIIGFSDMLKSEVLGAVGNPKYVEYLNDINSSGRHLLDLIKDILDVSKIEAGAMDLADEVVDIGNIVGASLKMINERAEKAGVDLRTDIPAGLPPLRGDSLRLKQICLNLLGNAVKFTPPNGRVTVKAGIRNGGGIFVTVKDTGVGIAEEDLERVTEPFTQGSAGINRTYEGTGLGLALVKSLVELHQGSLEIESRPGRGTEVTVFFPKERTIFFPKERTIHPN